MSEICTLGATKLQVQIRKGELSAREVVSAHLAQIEQHNGEVNAICTLVDPEIALGEADAVDQSLSKGSQPGPLAGLPIAIKDLVPTKGIRTTMGSLVFEKQVPEADALFVERIRQAGGVVIGKTNTPEFGMGSHTFNKVFGITRNPYNPDKTAGGSSGGAAAALAARMLPFADGSDLGGSLRNPAAFCNVVGFRPSLGRVPIVPNIMGWHSRLAVNGPMARNVEDCALLFRTMAGPDLRDPISLYNMPEMEDDLESDPIGQRIGWSDSLGGLPIHETISDTFSSAKRFFTELGCKVDETPLDLTDAMDVFRVLRASHYAEATRDFFEENRDKFKESVIGNVELGLSLTGQDITAADAKRTEIYLRMLDFFESHDFLVAPTTQVEPFDVETEWVSEINGITMQDYIEWMSVCCVVTVTGLPAISMPCGFNENGLPVGLQIIGGPGKDWDVLQLAKAFESVTGFANQLPAILSLADDKSGATHQSSS